MKPAVLLIAVIASVLAGAGGGFLATKYSPEAEPQKAKVAVEAVDLGGNDDAAIDLQAQDKKIARLQSDLNTLLVRLEQAEKTGEENAKQQDTIKKLEDEIAALKKAGSAVVATDEGGNPVPTVLPNPNTDEFKEAVAQAIEEKEAADRAQRDADREKRMADMMAARNKTILDKLSTELSLTEVQKTSIDTILADMNTKRGEVMQRGRAARDAGEEFDWGAEMTAVSTEGLEAVKAELSSAQQSTLTDLLGDSNSLDSLAGGWGGRGGNRGGPGGGRGN
ncbi:MAG: hypothetical protein R3E76_12120 [Planctomycetota bacterium]